MGGGRLHGDGHLLYGTILGIRPIAITHLIAPRAGLCPQQDTTLVLSSPDFTESHIIIAFVGVPTPQATNTLILLN